MDFIKIEEKLNQRAYDSKIDFIDDLNTMFLNCVRYNGIHSGM